MAFANGRPANSPRAADTAEGTTDKEKTVPVDPPYSVSTPSGMPDLPRIAPPVRISEETMDAWGVDPVKRITRDVQDAREDLMDAMALADRKGLTEIHRQIADRVLALEDLQTFLSDWTGS